MNVVMLSGRMCADPEARATKSGTSVAEFRLAVSGDRQRNEETVFVDVVVFGKRADEVARIMHKGSVCMVTGHLRYEAWESQGTKRSKISVIAEEVTIPIAVAARMETDGDGQEITF